MQNELEAKELYNEMRRVGRLSKDDLHEIATMLCRAKTSRDTADILIGGWHLDEELHGGYENSSGSREVLGKGTLLYSDTVSSKELITLIHQPLRNNSAGLEAGKESYFSCSQRLQ